CDRYMEIWNNVFSQFNNMGDGTYTELEHKNIDTGMGLERLSCVMQGVDNMFEVDTIRRILDKVCELSGKSYGENANHDISIRAVTDHIRAATFMISDGIIPSNEGRGYVLRRLLRRASRHGKLLGIDRAFLTELCDTVIAENKAGYPELEEKQELIKKVIANEELNFHKTIDQGLAMLAALTRDGGVLSGEDAFKLYDTYGFPLDLTKDILAEKNMSVDEETFRQLMQKQRELARSARKAADAQSWKSDDLAFDDIPATIFLGYTETSCNAKILDIVSDGEHTALAPEGIEAVLVLDQTVFYAESGGQIGDTGVITAGDAIFTVTGTQKTAGGVFLHFGRVTKGTLMIDNTAVTATIDEIRRAAVRRNHTAAHLLQAGLRKVLGTHVEQAGQFVNEKTVRFDFTHFSALSAEELQAVETFVNDALLADIPVDNTEMPIEEARKQGAMALFGEKYGNIVRVVKIADRSMELCGGTHVDRTGKIGLFHILSESGIAAGVRRIEAVTGYNLLNAMLDDRQIMHETAACLKLSSVAELPKRAEQLAKELRETQKLLEQAEAKLAAGKTLSLLQNAKPVGSVRLITAVLPGANADELRKTADAIKANHPDAIAVLACENDGKLTLCAVCGKDAVKAGAHAGNLVRETAKLVGGNGGGKPDLAMAGGKEPDKIHDALSAVEAIVKAQLGG
ncbi:MAG: alanine--tRNA ligase, partial [Clostridia bacterium]|nr:alanine--tRNA ligase [Clostridia bacterium]